MKDLKDVDPKLDLLGIEWRTLYGIQIGLTREEAFAVAMAQAGL